MYLGHSTVPSVFVVAARLARRSSPSTRWFGPSTSWRRKLLIIRSLRRLESLLSVRVFAGQWQATVDMKMYLMPESRKEEGFILTFYHSKILKVKFQLLSEPSRRAVLYMASSWMVLGGAMISRSSKTVCQRRVHFSSFWQSKCSMSCFCPCQGNSEHTCLDCLATVSRLCGTTLV